MEKDEASKGKYLFINQELLTYYFVYIAFFKTRKEKTVSNIVFESLVDRVPSSSKSVNKDKDLTKKIS